MARPATSPSHSPDQRQRLAFEALYWAGLTFDAAMHDPARRDTIEFIATRWPERPMENIVSISRISWLATDAAQRHHSARDANPYTEHSAAGGLFIKCFYLEKKRLAALSTPAQAAIETVAT